jgi:predicted heme/steroid binding protein
MALIGFDSTTYNRKVYINTDQVMYVMAYEGDVVQVSMSTPNQNGHPFALYVRGDADDIRKQINGAMSR